MNTNTVTKYTTLGRCIIAIILISAITGCATMSKQDCIEGNWQKVGYKDGIAGQTTSRFPSHVKACAKHDVGANEPVYLTGYEDGVLDYCQPRNGMLEGARNHSYRGICPAELETAFLEQYIMGLQIARRDLLMEYWHYGHRLDDARFRRARMSNDHNRRDHINRRIYSLRNKLDSLRSERNRINWRIYHWRSKITRT